MSILRVLRRSAVACLVIALLGAGSLIAPVGGTHDTRPTAAFSVAPETGRVGETFTFTDESVPGPAAIVSWAFAFGDGSGVGVARPAPEDAVARPVARLEPGLFGGACFVDDDGDKRLGQTEGIYLSTSSCGWVSGGDVRLVPVGLHQAGSVVRATDADFGSPSGVLALPVRFYDADGDAALSLGDTVYGDLDGSGTVTVEDLRLSPFGPFMAGSRVAAGDPDVLQAFHSRMLPAPADWQRLDGDGDGTWGAPADGAFIDTDADGYVSVMDVQVTQVMGAVDGEHADVVFGLQGAGFAEVGFVDEDASLGYDPGEPVYAVPAPVPSHVPWGALRIVAPAGSSSGTQVRAVDDDFGAALATLSQAVGAFYDANGDGDVSLGDSLYLDSDGSGSVSAGDVRLTSFGPFQGGSAVTASDVDAALPLDSPSALDPSAWRSFDANGDEAWTHGDAAFIDADADGFATPGDVRLGDGVHGFGSFVTAGQREATALGRAASAGAAFVDLCHVDGDGSGTYTAGETIYASRSACALVGAGDLRVSGDRPFSLVRTIDDDFGVPSMPLTATCRFYDADGDGTWSFGDTLYMARGGTVGVGDTRLTAFGALPAGSQVLAGDVDVNLVLPAAPGVSSWDFLDQDGNGAWSYEDNAFVDFGGDAAYSGADVLLLEPTPPSPPVQVQHAYSEPGDYVVTLTVTDEDGASDTTTRLLTVEGNALPELKVAIGVDQTDLAAPTGDRFGFTTQVSGAQGDVTVTWTFGDGTHASGRNASHAYVDDGVYTITATARDGAGRVAYAWVDVTVLNRAPVLDIGGPGRVTDLQDAVFSANASDADGQLVSYAWSFGDGGSSDVRDPVHRFAGPGSYDVCLSVTDDDGANATACRGIEVVPVLKEGRAAGATGTGLFGMVSAGDTSWNGATGSSYTWSEGEQVSAGAVTVTEAKGEVWLEGGSSRTRARFSEGTIDTGAGRLVVEGVDTNVETACGVSTTSVFVGRIVHDGLVVWHGGIVPTPNTSLPLAGVGMLTLNAQRTTEEGLHVTGVLLQTSAGALALGVGETAVGACTLL